MNRLSAMEAFVRVIETGSFSGAARQLRIGQPAVSKAIAQIEERLDVRLLLRTTHGLSLTESGQNFYEHAKRAIEEGRGGGRLHPHGLARLAPGAGIQLAHPLAYRRPDRPEGHAWA